MTTGPVLRNALASIGAVGKQIATFDQLAAGASDALRRAPGLTVPGAAAFLATTAQESAYYRTAVEYGKKLRYDPYRGRTFTQITWEGNYRAFGRWCHARGLVTDPEYFVKNPKALGDVKWAWLGPIQYWETNNIWRWANKGDFLAVSQAINGGNGRVGTRFTPHGWRERKKMYDAFMRAGAALLPTGGSAPAPSKTAYPTIREGATGPLVGSAQHWFNRTFPSYSGTPIPILTPPVFGPKTAEVVREFQRRTGIPDGGPAEIGPRTWAKMTEHGFRG